MADRHIWLYLGLAAIVLLGFRAHAFSLPLETDECNYAYIGARLLEGDRLYQDVWDHQPPGVFVMFAGVIALFGHPTASDQVFRWLASGFAIASLVLVFDFVRRHYGRGPAVFAAFLFAVTSSDPGSAGEGCNREIYMNFLALAALWLLTPSPGAASLPGLGNGSADQPPTLREVRGPASRSRLLVAGLLFGIGSTFKTVMAAQWLFVVLWLAVRAVSRSRNFRAALAPILWMCAGPAAVWLSTGSYFALTGRWSAFTEAVFAFNIGYSGLSESSSLWSRYADFATVKPYVFHSARPLWLVSPFALLGLLALSRRRLASTDGAIVAYLLGSFHAVCLPGLFWPHYYQLLFPPMILVCAALLRRVIDVGSPRPVEQGATRVGPILIYGAAALVAGTVLAAELRHYLLVEPAQITAPRYDYRQQWARAQGLRVAALTDPEDSIFVWGKDAGIYFYSDRRCASRYTMVGALGDHAIGYQQRRKILMEELQTNRPRL
ncbi:MAG: hypothetical protein IID39_07295, partial [Planctomycetes bacterium]|nr:hypothetical protein [Planctomycetota bacterium]